MYIKSSGNHTFYWIGCKFTFSFFGCNTWCELLWKICNGYPWNKMPIFSEGYEHGWSLWKARFFLERSGLKYILKRSYCHWYQVQGQHFITCAPFCDFVTYTRPELNIESIYPCVDTMSMLLEKMSHVYFNYFKFYFQSKNQD